MNKHNLDLNEFDYPVRIPVHGEGKDPTLTFIGGLVIGLVVGGLLGAVIEGAHLLNVLGY